jgi:hypothetical protein
MAMEIASNPPLINPLVDDDDAKNHSGSESTARATSYSPTREAALMANGKNLEMFDFFKNMSVTDDERQGYHDHTLVAVLAHQ